MSTLNTICRGVAANYRHALIRVNSQTTAAVIASSLSPPLPSSSSSRVLWNTKQNRSFSDSGEEKGDRLTNILIRAINSRPRPRPKFTPEEYAKHYEYGRNYVIGRFQVHNEINHDLACKIRLKEHAIRMMPRRDDKLGYLREKALEVDDDEDSMPPMYRPIPLDTPPVEGYDVSQFVARDE